MVVSTTGRVAAARRAGRFASATFAVSAANPLRREIAERQPELNERINERVDPATFCEQIVNTAGRRRDQAVNGTRRG
jgi:hypothetical protein